MKLSKFIILSFLLSFLTLAGSLNISGQRRSLNESKDFAWAVKENAKLRFSLNWTLGRKSQRGWYLYVPLIQHTLQTQAESDSADFAKAVQEWQRRKRLKATGVVEKNTLYSFIRYWQSKRIRPITEAAENQLLTASIANFFDPTRDTELLRVQRDAFFAYRRMVEAAVKDSNLNLKGISSNLAAEEKFLKIVSSYRSPAYQKRLRQREPGASRAQLAFRSPHFTGRALDIYVGGEPVTTKDHNRAIQVKTPVYKWLVKNAEKFGFYPYFYEPWHWEYVPENMSVKAK